MKYPEVLEKYGFPVVSKETADYIWELQQGTTDKMIHKRLNGSPNKYKSGMIPKRWQHLIKAPFKSPI